MKRTALLLMAISLLFASCNKEPENEWSRFYGFTQADVVGHYEANPDESLYEPLPTEGIAVYDNASMDVVAVGSSAASIHIVIPGKVNKSFSGSITLASSDIVMTNVINSFNKEDIMMTVYKNDKGQVRFHGRVKRYYYENDTNGTIYLKRSDNWGFDVIKQE